MNTTHTTTDILNIAMFLVHTLRGFIAFVLACPATGESFSLSGTILGLLAALGFLRLTHVIVRIIRDAITTNF